MNASVDPWNYSCSLVTHFSQKTTLNFNHKRICYKFVSGVLVWDRCQTFRTVLHGHNKSLVSARTRLILLGKFETCGSCSSVFSLYHSRLAVVVVSSVFITLDLQSPCQDRAQKPVLWRMKPRNAFLVIRLLVCQGRLLDVVSKCLFYTT